MHGALTMQLFFYYIVAGCPSGLKESHLSCDSASCVGSNPTPATI